MFRRNIAVTAIVLLISAIGVAAHDNGAGVPLGFITGEPVHQDLAKEGIFIWHIRPQEITDQLSVSSYSVIDPMNEAQYYPGEGLVIGSAEEDQEFFPDLSGIVKPRSRYSNGFMEHFWDADQPNFGGSGAYDKGFSDPNIYSGYKFASAFRKAEYLWNTKVIGYYTGRDKSGKSYPVDKGQAFYWLGRVTHLLEDMAVPSHVHLVPHDPLLADYKYGGKDPFESHVAQPGVYDHYHGSNMKGMAYKIEDLPSLNTYSKFPWTSVRSNPTPLFKLFWYTAQKTEYFASGGAQELKRYGDSGKYVTLNGSSGWFAPSLWQEEGVTPIFNPDDVAYNLPEMADALVPHAMQAVAGLYRLFWLETVSGSSRDKVAKREIMRHAEQDDRFYTMMPETFGVDLTGWDPNWELRWIAFRFESVYDGVIEVFHATYKANPAYRYVMYYDPDANAWTPWEIAVDPLK